MGVAEFSALSRTPATASEKAGLITEALDTLRTAHGMDERESLALTSWVAWYDATIPQVRDIKILVGAMEIEMHRRRGEQVESEGERRGGDQKSHQIKVRQCLTLIGANKFERSRDHCLVAQPTKVIAYIQQEEAAGRVPSVRGAVRAVKSSARHAKRTPFTGQVSRARLFADRWIAGIETVADGERRTDKQIRAVTGMATQALLQRIRLLPWLAVDRTVEGTRFVIDQDLRAICEGRVPRPALGNQSLRAYVQTVRAEITRRRKENHDEFRQRKWNSDLILKREQTALLDWIEEQLMKVPT